MIYWIVLSCLFISLWTSWNRESIIFFRILGTDRHSTNICGCFCVYLHGYYSHLLNSCNIFQSYSIHNTFVKVKKTVTTAHLVTNAVLWGIFFFIFYYWFIKHTIVSSENNSETLCVCACMHAQLCPILCDPWAIVHQAFLSIGFPKKEHWSGLPFLLPGDIPDPGFEHMSLIPPALSGRFFTGWAIREVLLKCIHNIFKFLKYEVIFTYLFKVNFI